MSTSQKTSLDIFRHIMDLGPLSLYSANAKTRIPIGTIHRHIKQLENAGKIRIYESKTDGRKKIQYGPTIYGMIGFYRQDKKFASSIQNYFLLWIENKEFQKELEKEGFDITMNLTKSQQIFKKYMSYFSAVEDQIEKIKTGDNIISREILILISSGLLSSDPYYSKLWQELYQNLPGVRKSLDEYMTNMIKSYKEFKKEFSSKL
ncbi:MAG TPA: helix-turn-helix domain-containing protein [Nitrosopumilaceae archaeon]|nr:helix-turn-helix domain-containing protein [Nitrosopumilaceae archaeon]